MKSCEIDMFVQALVNRHVFLVLQSVENDDDSCSLKSKGSERTSSANISTSNRIVITVDPPSHGVQVWGNSFEKLLEDAAGLYTFAEFLKKEFSAENIYFWTACERYRKISDHAERTKEANAIFSKHLATGASEPVNVDSRARTLAQEKLNYAEPDLFMQVSLKLTIAYYFPFCLYFLIIL